MTPEERAGRVCDNAGTMQYVSVFIANEIREAVAERDREWLTELEGCAYTGPMMDDEGRSHDCECDLMEFVAAIRKRGDTK